MPSKSQKARRKIARQKDAAKRAALKSIQEHIGPTSKATILMPVPVTVSKPTSIDPPSDPKQVQPKPVMDPAVSLLQKPRPYVFDESSSVSSSTTPKVHNSATKDSEAVNDSILQEKDMPAVLKDYIDALNSKMLPTLKDYLAIS